MINLLTALIDAFPDAQLFYVTVLLATGMTVGFFCGLLGIGGGFVMVPVQIWCLTSSGIEPTIATRIAFGTSLAVVLPTTLCGCRGHSCRGVVLWQPGITMGLSGTLGAFLGGTIASHAPGDLLKIIFGIVVLLGAARMLFSGIMRPIVSMNGNKPVESQFYYIFGGFFVGMISGLCGIGGGVILIPIMVIVMHFSMLQAIGTSCVAIAFNALGGILAYAISGWGLSGLPAYCVGYIDILQFILLAGASVSTASWGVRVAHRLPAEKLRYIFVILMMYIGLQMIGVFDLIPI